MKLKEIFTVIWPEVITKGIGQDLWNAGFRAIVFKSVGTDNGNIKALKEIGFIVKSLPDYGSPSVAQHAYRMLHKINREEIKGKNALVIGYKGNIGKELMKISRGYGLGVWGYDIKDIYMQPKVYFQTCLNMANYIFIAIPLTKRTKNYLKTKDFQTMKNKPYIIDISGREGLIDLDKITRFLKEGRIKGFASDYFPKSENLDEIRKYNSFFTNHVATHTPEAQARKEEEYTKIIKKLLK